MNTYVNKRLENKSAADAYANSKKGKGASSTLFTDNRPQTIFQRTLQQMANTSEQVRQLITFHHLDNDGPIANQTAQLQSASSVIQRVLIDGINVTLSGKMPQWEQGGRTYHLNLTTDPPHVTCEDYPAPTRKKKNRTTKMHFFYRGGADGISDAVSGQRGKKKFSDLPSTVQDFVADNYLAIISVNG